MSTTAAGRVVGDYILGPRIGFGSFSVVWRARHRLTGDEVAVKEMSKTKLKPKVRDSLVKEISILRSVSHPNIVSLHDAIQTEEKIYLVLEYCAGGDLSEYIQRHGRVSDDVARHFMRQLASGLRFLWENNLIHRDLKPQNLLLSTSDEIPVLKIGDFGFARYLMPQGFADTLCGSPLYMAPEIIQNKRYDAKADLWSVGAILFQLVTGKPPFDGNSQFQLFQNILTSNDLQFPQDVLASLHPDCIELCRSLLRRNPVERLAFDDFFNHKFMAMPRVSESRPESTQNTIAGKLGKTIDYGSSYSSNTRSMKAGSVDQGLLNASAAGVSDSFDSIEREYVLVSARFASMDLLPSSLEISLRDSSTIRPPSYANNKVGESTTSPMQTGALIDGTVPPAESMENRASPHLLVSQAATTLEEVRGTTTSHPLRRLQSLYHYICALTELAQKKLNVGLHLESFSIELVILAIWEEALRACNSWMASVSVVDAPTSSSANYCPVLQKDDHSSAELEAGVDLGSPLSVCSWVKREFLVAYDRAENISNNFKEIDGNVKMPDAMEIIFQTALSAGKSGAVKQLMGHMSRAATSYLIAITLLTFIMAEAPALSSNTPFLLSPDDQQRIHKYIISLRGHLKQCQMTELPVKQIHDSP